MTDSITDAARCIALCADAVHARGETWLTKFSSDMEQGCRVIRLTGSKPGWSALIEWDEESGFKVEIYKPLSHYYEVVRTAEDAYSRVLLLACD